MRIASLAPSVTEILYELGAESDIVCSTFFCDFPPAAKQLPKVGSWINIDSEKLKTLTPDIVFTSSAVQGPLTRTLQAQGFRVVNVNPQRLHEVVESYNQIGELVERRVQARQITEGLYKAIMTYHLKPLPAEVPRVYCEEWSVPPMVAGNWVPDLVSLAGGRPVIGEAGSLSRKFALEELISSDPHIIILHICGMAERAEVAEVMMRPGWAELSAVRDGKIFVVDDSLLNRPTSRLLLGLKRISEIIQSNAVT